MLYYFYYSLYDLHVPVFISGFTLSSSLAIAISKEQISCETSHSLAVCVLLGRWCMTIELLGRVCAESVGKLKHSVFNQLQGFEATERDLRREMDYLRSSAHRDLQIEVCYMYSVLDSISSPTCTCTLSLSLISSLSLSLSN